MAAYLIELTVPWEDSVEEAYERKKLCYAELAAEAKECGWNTKVHPVEVGCRGFVASSTIRLLKDLRSHGQALWRTIRAASETDNKKRPVDFAQVEQPLLGAKYHIRVNFEGSWAQDTSLGMIILQWSTLKDGV